MSLLGRIFGDESCDHVWEESGRKVIGASRLYTLRTTDEEEPIIGYDVMYSVNWECEKCDETKSSYSPGETYRIESVVEDE